MAGFYIARRTIIMSGWWPQVIMISDGGGYFSGDGADYKYDDDD